jgi:hypothetical protein
VRGGCVDLARLYQWPPLRTYIKLSFLTASPLPEGKSSVFHIVELDTNSQCSTYVRDARAHIAVLTLSCTVTDSKYRLYVGI